MEKVRSVENVRKHISDQLETAVESKRAILQADLESLEPMAREMMQRTLKEFSTTLDKI